MTYHKRTVISSDIAMFVEESSVFQIRRQISSSYLIEMLSTECSYNFVNVFVKIVVVIFDFVTFRRLKNFCYGTR